METKARSTAGQRILVVLKGYPRISETFIAQEILALEQAGFALTLISLRHPTSSQRHPVNDEISASVFYLPEYLHQEPVRVLKAWYKARKLSGYKQARGAWIDDFLRDRSLNRIRRFGQAMVLAVENCHGADWIYSHFIHTPSSVARYAAQMCNMKWSASAHAKDIWTSPDWELSEKLGSADWTVTCTAGGAQHLRQMAPDSSSVHLVYHGLDLSRFSVGPRHHSNADGSTKAQTVRLLSVGRAVRKKGFDVLLDALALLPKELHWQWTHVGGGDLSDELKAQTHQLNLDDKVTFAGSKTQQAVLASYRDSDAFVLPCRIEENGDRDGLPNVIVEAQSQALCVVSTHISGIPELIEHQKNGLLIAPDNAAELAGALEEIIRNPEMRASFGTFGEDKVRAHFNHLSTIEKLINLFKSSGIYPNS